MRISIIRTLMRMSKISIALLLVMISYSAHAEYYLVNSGCGSHARYYRGCAEYRPCYYRSTYIRSVSPRRHQPNHAGVSEYEWVGDP